MKFVISSGEMKSAVIEVSKVIASKNLMQIMECVRIDVREDGDITFSAYSEEVASSVHRKAMSVESGGSVCATCKTLLSGLGELPEQLLTVSAMDAMTISHAKGRFSIPLSDVRDWPSMAVVDEASAYRLTLPAETVVNALARACSAVTIDELRPIMGGVFVGVIDDKVDFVGSNGALLVRVSVRHTVAATGDWNMVIPQKSVRMILSTRTAEGEQLSFATDKKRLHAVFGTSGKVMDCRLLEGMYPNWRRVIPSGFEHEVKVMLPEMIEAIKRAKVFSDSASNLIRFDVSPNKIVVSTQNIGLNTSAVEEVPCTAGSSCVIGFDAEKLANALGTAYGQDGGAVIRYNSPSSAIGVVPTIQPENVSVFTMVMPMTI